MSLKHVVIRTLMSWAFGGSPTRLASGWVGPPLIHSRQDFSANDPEEERFYSAHFLARFGAIRFSASKLNSGELNETQHDTGLAYHHFPRDDSLSHRRPRRSPVISWHRHRDDLQRK